MARNYLDSIEDDAIHGLPHFAQVLYFRCLRRFVDYKTGIVGISRLLSYPMFRETLEVIRERGSTIREPRWTQGQCKAAISQLERAGLVVRVKQNSAPLPLVFRLPFTISEVKKDHSKTSEIIGTIEEYPKHSTSAKPPATTPTQTENTHDESMSNTTPEITGAAPPTTQQFNDKSEMNNTPLRSKKIDRYIDSENKKTVDNFSFGSAMTIIIEGGIASSRAMHPDHRKCLADLLKAGATKNDLLDALEKARLAKRGEPFSVFYLATIITKALNKRKYPDKPTTSTGERNGKTKFRGQTGAGLIATFCESTLQSTEEGKLNE